jgi:hypothetical protein
MKKFFHISIIWRGTPKSSTTLQPIFDLADDWIFLGYACWIIYTGEHVSIWQGRIIAVLGSTDTCFISEITDVHGTAGWLSPSAWEWLRKDRSPIPYLIPPS